MSDLLELLKVLIRNRCVNDATRAGGNEAVSVRTLAEFFGAEGRVVEPSPGRQSVIYRVAGTTPDAPRLAMVPHLDVVPANPDGWSVDPFGAEVVNGWVWGRGAVDMLDLTAAMAAVFRPYLAGELPPLPGDLLFIATADEEAGGGLGARVLVEGHWDLVSCEYLLTEVGYPALAGRDGPVHPISVGEKGPYWTRLRARGRPGHASVPFQSDNALEAMTEALWGLFNTPSPVTITEDWRRFVAGLDLPAELRADLVDPEQVDAAIDLVAADDPGWAAYLHAVTHLTVSPDVLRAGVKSNVIPDLAEAEVDLRGLPGMDRLAVDEHLRKAMGAVADRIEIVPVTDFPATASAPDNLLWDSILDGLEAETGNRSAIPTWVPAATDARFWRSRGTVCHGVSLFDEGQSFSEFLALFHGNDERVSIRTLEKTASLLTRVVAAFGARVEAG
jgi:acetylornithine deacetylase/succinyl-diaminopimelate desuccinylase-like protein